MPLLGFTGPTGRGAEQPYQLSSSQVIPYCIHCLLLQWSKVLSCLVLHWNHNSVLYTTVTAGHGASRGHRMGWHFLAGCHPLDLLHCNRSKGPQEDGGKLPAKSFGFHTSGPRLVPSTAEFSSEHVFLQLVANSTCFPSCNFSCPWIWSNRVVSSMVFRAWRI